MLCVFGQNLSGTYLRSDNATGSSEERVLITFNIDSTFKEVEHGHLGLKTYYTGHFSLKEGLLTLKYDTPKDENVLIEKNAQKSTGGASAARTTNLIVQVHDKDGEQNRDVVLLFRDKEGELVMGQMLDDEGRSPMISLFNNLISSLVVSTLGRSDVPVHLEPLIGSNATIDIFLSKVTYKKHVPDVCKFRLEKKAKNVILFSVEDEGKLAFKEDQVEC